MFVCLAVCISEKSHIQTLLNFLYIVTVTTAWSSCKDNVLRFVLLVMDCNLRLVFPKLEFGIENFVIPVSQWGYGIWPRIYGIDCYVQYGMFNYQQLSQLKTYTNVYNSQVNFFLCKLITINH